MTTPPLTIRLILALTTALLLCSHHESLSQDAPEIPPRKGRSANILLFNGRDLNGWTGDETYWSIDSDEIVGRNVDAIDSSTHLVTDAGFSDFRLTFEYRSADSTTSPGVVLWGAVENDFAYAGRLVAMPPRSGIYDSTSNEQLENFADEAASVERSDDWNRVELLAQGNRIRIVLNGTLISDWRDPEPDTLRAGPIGLQLHSASEPQEIRFRKLLLETFPEDRLTTLPREAAIEIPGIRRLDLTVPPGTSELWTSHSEVVIPDEILAPTKRRGFRQQNLGIQPEERDAYYAFLQKAREADLTTLRKAAGEFRRKRQAEAFNGKYQDRPGHEFPDFVDLYNNPELYHGKLITLQGHLRKLSSFSPDENPYGIEGQLWEGWLYDPHGQNHPAVIISTSRDASIEAGTEIVVDHVSVTGYFFKNYGFEAQDALRFAPMLIAQTIEHHPPAESINPFDLGLSARMQLLVAAIATLMVGRLGLRIWKNARADELKRRATREIASTDEAEPTFDNIVDDGGIPKFPDAQD